jgi:asparagine synthetase B (glutamine-hydrolysing)
VAAAAGADGRVAAGGGGADEVHQQRRAQRAAFADGRVGHHDRADSDSVFLHAEAVHRGHRVQRAEGVEDATSGFLHIKST